MRSRYIWGADCLQTLVGHKKEVLAVCVTQDDSQIVSGSEDRTVKESGKCLLSIDVGETVYSVCLSTDNSGIVSGSSYSLAVWNILCGECLIAFKNESAVHAVCMTSDDANIISGHSNDKIKLWGGDLMSFQKQELVGHSSLVTALCFTPDGSKVASRAIDDATMLIWDVQTGACWKQCSVDDLDRPINTHYTMCSNGKQILFLGRSFAVDIWDIEAQKCVATLIAKTADLSHVCLTPDGQRIIALQKESVQVWDLQSMECLCNIDETNHFKDDGDNLDRFSSVISTDSKTISVFTEKGRHKIWDIQTGRQLYDFALPNFPKCNSSCWHPDGRKIICATNPNHDYNPNNDVPVLSVWDVQSGEVLLKIPHKTSINDILVTSDGNRIVTGSADHTVQVWDMVIGKCLACFYHSSSVNRLAISADGNKIVCGYSGGHVRLFELISA